MEDVFFHRFRSGQAGGKQNDVKGFPFLHAGIQKADGFLAVRGANRFDGRRLEDTGCRAAILRIVDDKDGHR